MKTPFYPVMLENHAVINETAWNTAAVYTNIPEEHWAVRNAVGATDWSTMSKFDVIGPDAKDFLQYMVVGDVSRLYPGRVMYCSMVTKDGGIFDDTTVYCYSEEHYMLVGSTAGRKKDASRFEQYRKGKRVYITDITGGYGLLSLQGPNSRDLINAVAKDSISELKYYHFMETSIADRPVLISRTGFTGELGFEVYIRAEDCVDVWHILQCAGDPFGLKLVGLSAASGILRLEKGLIGGADYGEDVTPYEVGLGWTVALDTQFIGRDALAAAKAAGPRKKLMGYQMVHCDKVAKKGMPILHNGHVIGHVTSGCHSLTFNKSLGLGFIDPAHAAIDTVIQINIDGELVDAVVCPKNMYDPTGARLKG